MEPTRERPHLLYVLYTSELYGTERMALSLCESLRGDSEITIACPSVAWRTRPLIPAGRARGFEMLAFHGGPGVRRLTLGARLLRYFVEHPSCTVVVNRDSDVRLVRRVAAMAGAEPRIVCVIHGACGTEAEEAASFYGDVPTMNGPGLRVVTVSQFMRDRIMRAGVSAQRIEVIENFLTDDQRRRAPARPAFAPGARPSVRRVVLVSRLHRVKRIDLLLDALDLRPELAALEVRIIGGGPELSKLQSRAAAESPNVAFLGYRDDVGPQLAAADLFVHTCPVEPFGLVPLEAMAAGVSVLVPALGGAGQVVEDGKTGFHFDGTARGLADRLSELMNAPAGLLDAVVAGGSKALDDRFAAARRISDYQRVLFGAA